MILNGTLYAQDSDSPDTIVVAYSNYLPDPVGQGNVSRYLDVIETALDEQNITVVFQESTAVESAQDVVASLKFLYVEGDLITIKLMPQINPVQSLSPVLTNGFGVYMPLPRPETKLIMLGLLYYSAGRCDLAEPVFMQLLDPDTIESQLSEIKPLNFYMGNCALADDDFDTAITYFERFTDDGLDFWGTNLAWTLLQTGKADEAIRLMDDAVESYRGQNDDSGLKDVLIARAQLHALAFDYDSAIADMDSVLELDPDNPKLYVLRGQIVLLTYEWDAVLADYNKALEIDPGYVDAYFYRGVLYYTWVKRDEALADFEHYLEVAPDGRHAAEAARYAESIRAEWASLGE